MMHDGIPSTSGKNHHVAARYDHNTCEAKKNNYPKKGLIFNGIVGQFSLYLLPAETKCLLYSSLVYTLEANFCSYEVLLSCQFLLHDSCLLHRSLMQVWFFQWN